jgi:NADPH-dependent curcumin reductase CurA
MPDRNRRVLLTSRPVGIPQAAHFSLDEAPLEPVGEGQFRVRNIYLSVDPAQRGWANDGTNYADPVPLGGVMRALAVGVVVETRHPDVPVGLHLYGWFGWQDYAVVGPDALMTRIDSVHVPLSAYAGVLGMNGLTAHIALSRIGQPRDGETVLVTTAAGAVGSIVGQLARAAGCRVLGLTGDDEKVERCTARFGYHAAANYKRGDAAGRGRVFRQCRRANPRQRHPHDEHCRSHRPVRHRLHRQLVSGANGRAQRTRSADAAAAMGRVRDL